MNSIFEDRIDNPKFVDRKRIEGLLNRGLRPTIQFSEPCYSSELLAQVNEACISYKEKLEVRFYGFYQNGFDASALAQIPDVAWLSVDCLMRISNVEQISELNQLRKLSFGVFEFNDSKILEKLNLRKLENLSLSENRWRNFDLEVLGRCEQLQTVLIEGHSKNIESLSSLPRLWNLTLRAYPRSGGLAFLNSCESLDDLTLILGGRTNIDDFSHSNLERLEITWVKGLERLGPLSRFPNLKKLHVADQLKLEEIDVSDSDVRSINIHNCKNLIAIKGLSDLRNLKEFRTSRTKLPLEQLMEHKWPNSLEILALYSSSLKWNDRAHEINASRGYREY